MSWQVRNTDVASSTRRDLVNESTRVDAPTAIALARARLRADARRPARASPRSSPAAGARGARPPSRATDAAARMDRRRRSGAHAPSTRANSVAVGLDRVADEGARPADRRASASRRRAPRRRRVARRPLAVALEERRVDLALAGIERRAQIAPGRGSATASASASSVGTPTSGRPPAKASPLAKLRPMRSPVNDPGPIETATRVDVARARARRRASTLVDQRRQRCRRGCAIVRSRALGEHVAVAHQRRRCSRPGRGVDAERRSQPRAQPCTSAMDVVVEDEHHQREQEEQADLLRDLAVAQRERAAAAPPRRAKNSEMPAVEHRDRQQVQHAEVDADQRRGSGAGTRARARACWPAACAIRIGPPSSRAGTVPGTSCTDAQHAAS